GGLTQLHWDEVLKRLDSDGDLLAGLEGSARGGAKTGGATKKARSTKKPGATRRASRSKKSGGSKSDSSSSDDDDSHRGDTDRADTETETDTDAVVTDLDEYRRKRDRRRTPEPFGDETGRDEAAGPVFVIQEHHARRLHYDFRLEHDGVLVSWAVPKNLPTEPRDRRLAVHTEDHPLGYETFEGRIPRGEYGAGTVSVWDHGVYECEKWHDDEVIVWLSGEQVSGRYVLVRTNAEKNQWIVQYMLDQSRGEAQSQDRPAAPPLPMIPTAGTVTTLTDEKWAFEGKWDGYRVTASTDGAQTRLVSRNGKDMTWLSDGFPGLAEALEAPAVIDGELVVPDEAGVPDFASLAKQAAAEGKERSVG